jgi:hypothetical protein
MIVGALGRGLLVCAGVEMLGEGGREPAEASTAVVAGVEGDCRLAGTGGKKSRRFSTRE